jgi:hypothetical protein
MAVSQKSLENLKKGRKFTKENASEYGRRGQWKSREAKLWKKARHELLTVITGEENVDEDDLLDALREQGIGDSELKILARYIVYVARAASAYLKNHPSH